MRTLKLLALIFLLACSMGIVKSTILSPVEAEQVNMQKARFGSLVSYSGTLIAQACDSKWPSCSLTAEQLDQEIKRIQGRRELPKFKYVKKRDYHPDPFRKVVVLGESHVAWREGWVSMLETLLRDSQGTSDLEVVNAGIGSNVISPRSPGYAASAKPSAMERFQKDLVSRKPDLAIISYGLNDMRSGMDPEIFREELSYILSELKKAIDPVIVLTTVYNMSTYDLFPPFDKGSAAATQIYNLVIRQVAEKYDALVADIWDAEGQAPWVICFDTVHANRLGHQLIAQRVFQTVITNCSGAAYSVKLDMTKAKNELELLHPKTVDNVIQNMRSFKTGHPQQ